MHIETGARRGGWLLAVMAWLMSACASLPTPTPVAEQARLWQQRQVELSRLEHWVVSGRIGIQSEDTGWHTSLRWQQDGDEFRIALNAPLGQGSAQLQGGSRQVELVMGDGQRLTAADPDSLINRALGTPVPVSGLRYWVRGLPVPALAATHELDNRGRLAWLEQSGWRITFHRYETVAGHELPTKIFLDNAHYKVRLIFDSWVLS
ncbi:MAG: lipoprotein insertase outer membrane protein LolB [Pseudomonadota bacterium]